MEVTTNEYHVDRRTNLRLSIKRAYRRLWWFVVLLVGLGALVTFVPNAQGPIVGAWVALVGIVTPGIQVYLIVNRAAKHPASKRRYQIRFLDTAFEQMCLGEVVARLPYEDVIKTSQMDGYFLIWISKTYYALVPLTAFATDADRDTVLGRFREMGKLK